jgi:sugar/nucleoside kinase (ribokinase family)
MPRLAVARLGGRVCFSGPLGTDDASRRFLSALAKTGVDPPGARRRGRRLDLGVRHLHRPRRREDGRHHARQGPRRRDLADGPAALVADIDVLLVDNRFPAFVAPICRAAADRGIPVVLDVDKATRPGDPLFAAASHLISPPRR